MIERVTGAWGKAVMRAVMMPVVAAFVALSLAAAAQAAGRDKVEVFLKVTGFDVALDSIALAAEDAPAMLGMRADDFGYQWKRAAADVFDTAQMREMALGLLEKTLSDDLLPDDPVTAHRGDYSNVPELSPKALANLRQWYSHDYAFVRMCEAYIEAGKRP